ncbi:MAG: bifunctional riboflavin kinase/FAD synthetase [Finegoldia sp.]|nr:bifunctional riboflavin kinase/FAD synthetase [Finegoldia sp.]
MKIIDLDKKNRIVYSNSLTMGNFDGIHLAHQKLINTANKYKPSGILFFKNHTLNKLKDTKFRYLLSLDDKIFIAERLGIDNCYIKEADYNFLSTDADLFINKMYETIGFKNIVVGDDFKFGKGAKGDINLLLTYRDKFHTHILLEDKINNIPIRSTVIRTFLADGDVESANKLLYRPYSVKGEVVHGLSRGKKLGFPTLNLRAEDYLIPKDGVYYTNVIIDGNIYKGITSVGANLTYNENDFKIETNVLDFSDTIYGKRIELIFLEKMRENIKFPSQDGLINQLKHDKEYAEGKDINLQKDKYMLNLLSNTFA